jgi:hypothetical protein
MSGALEALERLWPRVHQRDDELRPRLAAWLRDLIPVPTGPSASQLVTVRAMDPGDGWRYRLSWISYPGPGQSEASPFHEFPIAPTVPEPLSADELRAIGRPNRPFVATVWLLEVFGLAWAEAGLMGRQIHLVLDGAAFRGPGRRFGWTDKLRAFAYRSTAPRPASIPDLPKGQVELVAPAAPAALPVTPAALRAACAAGEPGAVLAWADALAAAGDAASAELLRWLHGFPDTIADEVRMWAGHGPFWVFATADQCWWGCGEIGTEPDGIEEPADRLAQLLAGWNVYYPAAEWLLRRLGLARAEVCGSYFANGGDGHTFDVDLTAGHLAPLDETMGVTRLWCESEEQPEEEFDEESDE